MADDYDPQETRILLTVGVIIFIVVMTAKSCGLAP
jgi:hypothetical protein